MNLSYRDYVQSLASTVCPACGGKKNVGMTLCGKDYHSLPATLGVALFNRLGQGYETAVAKAFERLGKTTFILPPGTPWAKPEQSPPSNDQPSLWDSTARTSK